MLTRGREDFLHWAATTQLEDAEGVRGVDLPGYTATAMQDGVDMDPFSPLLFMRVDF